MVSTHQATHFECNLCPKHSPVKDIGETLVKLRRPRICRRQLTGLLIP
jgi:hypothetical protein